MKMTRFFVAACAAFLVAGQLQAGTFSNVLRQGLNVFEDQSRETTIDVNGNNRIDDGDIIAGWLRLDDRTTPIPGVSLPGDGIIVSFAQQVTNFSTTDLGGGIGFATWGFEPVTTPGLTFAELSGLAPGTFTDGTVGAVWSDVGINPIDEAPVDLNGNGLLDQGDFLRHFAGNGDLELVVGANPALQVLPDFQSAQTNVGFFANNPTFNLPLTDTLNLRDPVGASFDIGLHILENYSSGRFAEFTLLDPFSGPQQNFFGVTNGNVSGASDVSYLFNGGTALNPFSNPIPNGLGLTSANFFPSANNAVVSVFNTVPEPGSLSIFAVAALGMVGGRRRKKSNS